MGIEGMGMVDMARFMLDDDIPSYHQVHSVNLSFKVSFET